MCVLLDLVLLAIATSVMSPSLTVPSPKPYVELGSPLVQMPSVNLGTCCGSDPTVMSVKRHDDQTIEYCLKNNITYEAFGVMRGCPFTDQHVNSIAQKHAVSTRSALHRYAFAGCFSAGPSQRLGQDPMRRQWRTTRRRIWMCGPSSLATRRWQL